MIDKAVLERALVDANLGMSSAEAHGVLSAFACVDADVRQAVQEWLAMIDGAASADQAIPVEGWVAIIAAITSEIDDVELAFEPLLPGDDESLPLRVNALSDWAQGFTAALGLAGVADAVLDDESDDGQAREFVEMLTVVGRADQQADVADPSAEDDYIEIVEYLRMGTMYIRECLRGEIPEGQSSAED